MKIKSIIIRTAIVLVLILIILMGKEFFYYGGFYSPPPGEVPSYEHIGIPAAPSTEFTDEYVPGEGVVLIDLAHDNAFEVEELNVLTLRLISRGLTLKFLKEGDELDGELLNDEESGGEGKLEEEFAAADAFIVVCPQKEFSEDEKETVDKFVNDGGKLLLIADPTRRGKMNSLSLGFGLIFESGYLYNMTEYETNYRNIFVSEFKENEITKKLAKIALYTASSISSDNCGIAFVDQDTFSSFIETKRKLSPLALADESKVLAIHDLTFITEPHNGILDNNQLISNIADWLARPAGKVEGE